MSWWKHIEDEVPALARMGVTQLWLPPPNKAMRPVSKGIRSSPCGRVDDIRCRKDKAMTRTILYVLCLENLLHVRKADIIPVGSGRVQSETYCGDAMGYEGGASRCVSESSGTRDRHSHRRCSEREKAFLCSF
jgi:hypothetical protein